MIANISPCSTSFGETLSTLKFAQRTKLIKNRAVINEDSSATVVLLKEEIERLKTEIKNIKLEGWLIEKPEEKSNPKEIVQNIIELETFYSKELDERDEIVSKYKLICEMYEKQHYRDSMIIKFRDSTIKKLTESHNLPPAHLDSLQSQLDSYKKEESARVAHEQVKVRELKKALQKEENYEGLYKGLLKIMENLREEQSEEDKESEKDVSVMVRSRVTLGCG